ncbi:MAG: hypothetical protein Q4F83_05670 [Eubacteriales bacterium]|nr:hypothetical protein [Eubacteriales bacterium]
MQRKVKQSLTFLMALVMVMSLICGSGFSVMAEATDTSGSESAETGEALAETFAESDLELYQSEEQGEELLPQYEESDVSIPETDISVPETSWEETEETVSTETVTEESEQTEAVSETGSENSGETENETKLETETGTETETEADTAEEESETEESTEDQETEEKAKPEFTYNTTVNGVNVNIHAPEGILPEGTTVTVEPLAEDVIDTAVRTINDTLEEREVVQIIGFDISFFDDDGNEMHNLDGKVSIQFSGMEIVEEAEAAQVYHTDEYGNITNTLTEVSTPSGTVGFTSDSFSPMLYVTLGITDDVTVVDPKGSNEFAMVYYLKSPTSIPGSNQIANWGGPVTSGGNHATVNTTGATWDNDRNVLTNVPKYIVSWPDGSKDSTWTLAKGAYSDVYEAIYDQYKVELEREIGVGDLKLEDIEEITLIPYKISKNNHDTPDKHIDCTVSVKCSKAYIAKFWVLEPNNDEYTNVYNLTCKIVDGNAQPVKEYTEVKQTKTIDGITYRFDGWYPEAQENPEDQKDKVVWEYTPTQDELADGTVNFYAKYVQIADVIIEKKVTGSLGDVNKEFSFSCSYGNGSETRTFTLRNGQQYTIQNVPVGTTLTLTEINADGYEVSALYGDTSLQNVSQGKTMIFTIIDTGDEANKIVVINSKDNVYETESETESEMETKAGTEAPKKEKGQQDDTPKTGDNTNLTWWIALMGAAVIVLVGAVPVYRKRRNKKHS